MSHAIQLAAIVELLGRLWLHEVTKATLTLMRSDEFLPTYEQLGGYVPPLVDDEVVETLAVEYCELLIGPKGQLSPVQSVWVTNQFQSESSASMNRFFELLPGYVPQSNLSDHLGVELDFLSHLLRNNDESTVQEMTEHFAITHLEWSIRFLDQVEMQTDSKFYQGLAKVTRQLVRVVISPSPTQI